MTHPFILERLAADRRRDLHASVRTPATMSLHGGAAAPRAQPATIADVMERRGPRVAPDTPLKEVAALLAERQIPAVPVIDDAGRVLGIVTQDEILLRAYAATSRRAERRLGRRRRRANASKPATRLAGEVMTTPAPAVLPSTSLARAAKLFTRGTGVLAVQGRRTGRASSGR